jgi:hypothetical protein
MRFVTCGLDTKKKLRMETKEGLFEQDRELSSLKLSLLQAVEAYRVVRC